MKYSVLGFNQSKVIETHLDLTDLMLLKYIIDASASPKMKFKMNDEERPLVWLQHQKLVEDLPILRLAEGSLKNRLVRLKADGYITSLTVQSEGTRGSRTYYGITELTTSLIYDVKDTTTSLKNDVIERPRHSKVTSDIYTNLDNKLDNTPKGELPPKEESSTLTEFESKMNDDDLGKRRKIEKSESKKKESLWDKCVREIDTYTEDETIRERLREYLTMRLKMKDKPLYGLPQWRGILNKLAMVKGDPITAINYSIERGYASIYEPKQWGGTTDNKRKFGEDGTVVSKKVTQEEIDNGYFTGEVV